MSDIIDGLKEENGYRGQALTCESCVYFNGPATPETSGRSGFCRRNPEFKFVVLRGGCCDKWGKKYD